MSGAAIARDDAAVAARLEAMPTPLALLRDAAGRHPERTAILFLRDAADTAPREISYAALLGEVERIAGAFAELGVGEADAAALLLPSVPHALIAWIAATAVGTAFAMNPLLSADAIAAQLRLARARAVVTIGEHPVLDVRARVGAAAGGLPIVEVPIGSPTGEGRAWDELGAGERPPLPRGAPGRIAALFHTGGTTGEPKLAQLTARSLAAGALMAAAAAGWREEDRLVCALPLFHVGGAIDIALSGIAAGATIIFPGVLGLRDPAAVASVWSIVERTRATVLGAVPTSLAAIQNVPVGGADIATLRRMATGGSPLAPSIAGRIGAMTGRPVLQLYGMTETAGIIAAQADDTARPGLDVGLPVPLMETALDEPGGPCLPGLRGELLVRGPNVFAGYRTAAGMEGAPADGWVRTGDIAELLEDGAVRIAGRSKDVIIRGGHNIDPVAIEEAAAAHPDVIQAGAVGMPDAYAGELPVLFVALREGASAQAAEIAEFVAARIIEPPARPKRLFVLDELPLTPFGKVARFRLRQRAAETVVREALSDGSEVTIECTDAGARRVRIGGLDAARRRGLAAALGELGLEPEWV